MPRIGIGIDIARRSGAIDWSSYWATRNAYFALPSTGVSLMVGQEVTIYGDTLINVPIGNPLVVTYTCDIGTQVGNNLVITPEAGDIGNHSLRMVFKNGSYTIEDKTIALTVYAKSTGVAKSILIIGDSTDGTDYIAPQIDDILDTATITYLGTQGTTYKNEGNDGYSYYTYNSNDDSPFRKDGALNIAAYFTDNSIADPDYVYIRLGINDILANCLTTGDGFTDLELAGQITRMKTLIDAFLAYNTTLKIILGIPTISENTGAGWAVNYTAEYSQDMHIENIHKLWVGIVDEFANGAYSLRVDCSYEAIFLDRNDGYPKVDGVHTNGVHPDQSGYEQLGVGLALKLNEQINDTMILTSTGDGSGVATLRMEVSADVIVSLGANAKFYSDAAGTANESSSWSLTAGALRTIYLKCTTGTAQMTFSNKTKVIKWGNAASSGWVAGANAPTITASFVKMPLTVVNIEGGGAVLSGAPPAELTILKLYSNSITYTYTGALPIGLTYLYLRGESIVWTYTGAMPPELSNIYLNGSLLEWSYTGALPAGLVYLYVWSPKINWTGLDIAGTGNITVFNLSNYRIAKMSSADMISLLTSLTNRVGALPATITINDYADSASPPAEVTAAVDALKAAKSITTVNLGA